MSYPLPDDPWDSHDSSHPPLPPVPAPDQRTIRIGRPPRKSTNTAALVVGVVFAVCCGLGGISLMVSALTGDPSTTGASGPAASSATSSPTPAAVEESAAYVAPSAPAPSPPAPPSASPSPRPRTTTVKPTPRKTTSSPKASCDPNYAGACVPIASDVDCGGGSGNGPAYFYGTARVVGSDIYDLDRDGDGIACEKD